ADAGNSQRPGLLLHAARRLRPRGAHAASGADQGSGQSVHPSQSAAARGELPHRQAAQIRSRSVAAPRCTEITLVDQLLADQRKPSIAMAAVCFERKLFSAIAIDGGMRSQTT